MGVQFLISNQHSVNCRWYCVRADCLYMFSGNLKENRLMSIPKSNCSSFFHFQSLLSVRRLTHIIFCEAWMLYISGILRPPSPYPLMIVLFFILGVCLTIGNQGIVCQLSQVYYWEHKQCQKDSSVVC